LDLLNIYIYIYIEGYHSNRIIKSYVTLRSTCFL